MKELYSIGKMSAMMGISAQVLRHYCDIGLITPEYIKPDTDTFPSRSFTTSTARGIC